MAKEWDDIVNEVMNSRRVMLMMQDPSQMGEQWRSSPHVNKDIAFNPQSYNTMMGPIEYENMMNPGQIVDPVNPSGPFNDTQTNRENQRRERQMADNVFRHPKTPSIDPTASPENSDLPTAPPPDPRGTKPPSMNELYNNMPLPLPPQYKTPQTDPYDFMQRSPDADMHKLMEFYTGGGQMET